jgi:hypothetical protein
MMSCAVSFSDINHKIGNGYFYLGEGKSQSYVYRSFNEKNPTIDEISIWPTVLSYDYDDNFLIAKQVPNEKAIKIYLIYFDHKSSESADSIIKTDKSFLNMFAIDTCYWIINKNTMVKSGPFNFPDFNEQRELLNISSKLEIK